MRTVTIRQALQQVADHPVPRTDDMVSLPVHELVCRTLFDIANNPMAGKRASMAQANVARGIILNRLVGRRNPGSHPATKKVTHLEFTSLTGELEA